MAFVRPLVTKRADDEESRFDGDRMYTKAEFLEYYGEDKGYYEHVGDGGSNTEFFSTHERGALTSAFADAGLADTKF